MSFKYIFLRREKYAFYQLIFKKLCRPTTPTHHGIFKAKEKPKCPLEPFNQCFFKNIMFPKIGAVIRSRSTQEPFQQIAQTL